MDVAWFRTSAAWGLLGKLSSVRDVAKFVAVADDDHAEPVITARARGRRLSGLGALSPSDPAVAAVIRSTAAATAVTVLFRVFRVTARSYQRRAVLAETVPAGCPVQAIARVRLAPDKPRRAFEWQLLAIPAVLSAVHVIGDVDYELRLACREVADLGAVLTSLRGCGAADVVSTELVLGEVPGLGQRGPAIPDGGTRPRPRETLSACPAWRPASGPAVRAWSPTVSSRSAACG